MENQDRKTNINWFPGHMQKAKRQMMESLKLVDIVIEIRDARIPYSSENPMLLDIIGNKPRIIVLTKKDMADSDRTSQWLEYFKSNGLEAISVNSNSDDLKKIIPELVKKVLKEKIEKAKARGIRKKVLRAMVCGIPNAGKSTLINNIVRKKAAKVENRPGVTKQLQWIRLNEDVELLDTPGVLWPRFSDQRVAYNLALVGSLNDQVVDKDVIIAHAINHLYHNYPDILINRYDIKLDDNDDYIMILNKIASSKKIYTLNNQLDINKTIDFILTDVRTDKLKNVTWEFFDESNNG